MSWWQQGWGSWWNRDDWHAAAETPTPRRKKQWTCGACGTKNYWKKSTCRECGDPWESRPTWFN
eukprot:4350442-Prorocentrum_lima.AAC.1